MEMSEKFKIREMEPSRRVLILRHQWMLNHYLFQILVMLKEFAE